MDGKPSYLLEEAQIPYDVTPIDFDQNEQNQGGISNSTFNGRIPTIVDRGNDDFVVFESGAIRGIWLKNTIDFFGDLKERSETMQWLMFQMGGVGPMMGQAMYFQRIAEPKGQVEPFSIQRYVKESRRLLEVLNTRLKGRTYLVGETYSIADMAMYPWARCFYWAKVPVDRLEHLQAWFDRIDARPLTQRALEIPEPFSPHSLARRHCNIGSRRMLTFLRRRSCE